MKALSLALITASLITLSWTSPTVKTGNRVPAGITTKSFSGESFSFFRTHRQNKGVTANWGTIVSQGITDFVVQQTYDDPTDPYANWVELNVVTCTNNRSFKYCDPIVYPGFASYRIVAMNGLTPVDATEVLTEHIVKH